jgi:2-C-methyl-D-erythritol 4-phosphate cytidylyltransferase
MARQAGSAAFCRSTGAGGITPIIVAIPEGAEEIARACVAGIDGVRFITGARRASNRSVSGWKRWQGDWPRLVLIHDAARPTLPRTVIDRLVAALIAPRRHPRAAGGGQRVPCRKRPARRENGRSGPA